MRTTSKPFNIDKQQVYEAYQAVKSNGGAAGVDGQTIEQFEADLKSNLYKIWNRMSSGSYFPPPVRAVSIPKKTGGQRILGVPTVADRVAQMVVKRVIEPDSGSDISGRLLRLPAGKIGAGCCRSHARAVLEIRLGFGVRHQRPVRQHRPRAVAAGCPETRNVQMGAAVHRAMAQGADGDMRRERRSSEAAVRPKGVWSARSYRTPFLHYAFDLWMARTHPDLPWCRYADDGLVHCRSEQEAQALKAELQARLAECGLELHPTKTKIVYCKDGKRRGTYPNVKFDFLGYCFRPRLVRTSPG